VSEPHTESMRNVLGPGGTIAQTLPGYEPREPQMQMAELVAQAIDEERHALVEAGTGVGKSLAYLIPAILSGQKTIVSTADKGLQDQLFHKDIPFLQGVLPVEFTAAILKGRANYLCIERWNQELGEQQMFGGSEEFAAVQEWLDTTDSGDIEELPITLSSEFAARITATADQCLNQHCPCKDDCFANIARDRADHANAVIVNHTLLTLDAAIRQETEDGASVLPDRELVIVDEAHRLEDAATLAFQEEISVGGISRLLRDRVVQDARVDQLMLDRVEEYAQKFFDRLALPKQQSYTISAPNADTIEQARGLASRLEEVAHELKHNNPHFDEMKSELHKRHVDRIKKYAAMCREILNVEDGHVVYVEKRDGKRRQLVYLRRCPVSVADSLKWSLFEKWPTICTSATLATAGGFDYLKSRCGCPDAMELIVGSPFDYGHNALIYMPPNALQFDPTRYYQDGSVDYFDRLASEIEQLLMASDGRAFCLFTSNKALSEIYDRIAHRLRWLVLKQGDAPRPELLRQFRESGQAVLFGLKSFWEGVDVRGDALSLVIIDKIPFGQPDDPIYDARCKEITVSKHNEWAWFNELALPSAIITYKQGFGRLIRTKSDYGVVALLDGRISTKRYGSTILRSLPKAAQTRSIEAVKTFFQTRQNTGTL
jgi:Rad3-related DNA helicase